VSSRYRTDDAHAGPYAPWLARLHASIPAGARVLDAGCGCGVPVARDLAAAGCRVTGVDVSDVQIERARRLVPGAEFVRADLTEVDLPAASFDAVVALYSVIHVPLDAQPTLLAAFARWLGPGGVLLMTAGATAWTGTETGWLGGSATMWWSHADAATYREWLADAGFRIDTESFVPEGDSGHSLFWAARAN
jgi:ubiquinone/menaquinone biosynthesis C-methylase UbiE